MTGTELFYAGFGLTTGIGFGALAVLFAAAMLGVFDR